MLRQGDGKAVWITGIVAGLVIVALRGLGVLPAVAGTDAELTLAISLWATAVMVTGVAAVAGSLSRSLVVPIVAELVAGTVAYAVAVAVAILLSMLSSDLYQQFVILPRLGPGIFSPFQVALGSLLCLPYSLGLYLMMAVAPCALGGAAGALARKAIQWRRDDKQSRPDVSTHQKVNIADGDHNPADTT